MTGLQKAFVDELRDAYDAEKQLIKALPRLAKAATAPSLRTAFLDHLEETRGHAATLEQVFAAVGEKARGKHCEGVAGIIEEGKTILEEDLDGATLDACLVAAGQRSEHYEIAAYGTLVAWANVLGHSDAAQLLESILDEEKAADETLTALAEGGINEAAGGEGEHGAEAEDEGGEGAMGMLRRTMESLTGGGAATRRGSKRARSSSSGRGRGRTSKKATSSSRRSTSSRAAKSSRSSRSTSSRKRAR